MRVALPRDSISRPSWSCQSAALTLRNRIRRDASRQQAAAGATPRPLLLPGNLGSERAFRGRCRPGRVTLSRGAFHGGWAACGPRAEGSCRQAW